MIKQKILITPWNLESIKKSKYWLGASSDTFGWYLEEITQYSEQVKMRLILQLINDISRVFQKLLKYVNGTAISTFFYYHH